MSIIITTAIFIKRANIIYNNKFSYPNTIYKKIGEKVEINCPIHNSFLQRADLHLKGYGCKQCNKLNNKGLKTIEKFIEQANKAHNNKYDYSKVVYKGNNVKINIVCPIHNEYLQLPSNHLKGHGCFKCGKLLASKNETCNQDYILNKFKKVHGDLYDYSKFIYIKSKTKSIVICKKHGEFLIEPYSHLQRSGCRLCGIKKSAILKTKSLEFFINEAVKIHGNKYDYSLVDYKGCKYKINIICNNCKKLFLQTPNAHLNNKSGCRNCGNGNNYHKDSWIKKANDKEGIFYIIKCWNENEEFFKLGITFNSVKQRYLYKGTMPYNYEIIKEIKSKDLSYIWNLEKRFKKFKRNQHYKPLIHFAGDKNECFKN